MQYIPSRAPLAHASIHEHGGSDEVATATPTANAIPKADSAGRISSGWLADVQTVADMAARHALTVAFKVKQTDTGHIHLFLGGDIASEANWMDLGHYNIAPSNTAAPEISGTAQVDSQLTAVEGTYGGYPTPSHASWQWQVSDDGATGWSDISGATSSTYTPVEGDTDKYLRVKETASNIVGSDIAYSAATAVMAGASFHWRLVANTGFGASTMQPGSNYQVDDILAFSIGNVGVIEQATCRVTSVDESGGVTGVTFETGGDYEANPGETNEAASGGSGSVCHLVTDGPSCFEQFTP